MKEKRIISTNYSTRITLKSIYIIPFHSLSLKASLAASMALSLHMDRPELERHTP